MRGAVWTHSAYIEHTSIPFNEVVELRAKYVFSRWDGINIGGIDIFGDEHYVPSASLKELGKRFAEFQETPGTRLLNASQIAAEGLI